MLKKKVRKTLFAHAVFNHPRLISKEMNFILGKVSELKKVKKIQDFIQKDIKKTTTLKDSTKTNISKGNMTLKKNSLNINKLQTKLSKTSLFLRKQKTITPKGSSNRTLLLARLEKKIKEKKHIILFSLLNYKPTKVFKKIAVT